MTIHTLLDKEATLGDILVYRLRDDQLPDHPQQLWRGVIKMVLTSIYDKTQQRYYLVTSLEAGYEGDRELVYPQQVVDVE